MATTDIKKTNEKNKKKKKKKNLGTEGKNYFMVRDQKIPVD